MSERSVKKVAVAVPAAGRADTARSVDLGVLEDHVGFNLRRAYGVQLQRFAATFRPLNIRPVQYSILALVYHNPEIKQSELGRALDIKRANIATLLDELEGRALLTRRRSSDDRRSHLVQLTTSGQRLTVKLLDLHARLEQDMANRLGARERERLLELLKAFRRLESEPELGTDAG